MGFMEFMRMHWGWILSFATVLISVVTFLNHKIKAQTKKLQALESGVQALLRAQMISDWNHYSEKGYAPIYAKDNFQNCWLQYEALGKNGVISGIRDDFMKLPDRKGNEYD